MEHRAPPGAAGLLLYSAAPHVPAGTDGREVPDPREPRLRRLRHRLPRARHLDRQEGRDQGPAPPDAATRTSCCRSRACSPPSTTRTSWGSSPPSAWTARSSSSWSTSRARAWRPSSTGRSPSTCPARSNYAVQILKGVEHAHEAQILHRDLRPANVLISESGVVQGGRLRHVAPPRALPRHDRDRQPALHGARGRSRAAPCSPPTSTRWA